MSPTSSSRLEETRARTHALFAELAGPGAADPDRIRSELVVLHTPLVHHLARRFQHRGESYEDLVQVGLLGLLQAIDRFDTDRGVEFSSYATPTVIGELKRHLRDKGWAIRLPRRLQELRLAITTETALQTQQLGRSPTASELAQALGCTVEQVVEGLESANAWATVSLDSADDESTGLIDSLGQDDAELSLVDVRESLRPLLADLEEREKKILVLRFFRNLTQSQIAEELGISQMHVSRLLTRTLRQLRGGLEDGD